MHPCFWRALTTSHHRCGHRRPAICLRLCLAAHWEWATSNPPVVFYSKNQTRLLGPYIYIYISLICINVLQQFVALFELFVRQTFVSSKVTSWGNLWGDNSSKLPQIHTDTHTFNCSARHVTVAVTGLIRFYYSYLSNWYVQLSGLGEDYFSLDSCLCVCFLAMSVRLIRGHTEPLSSGYSGTDTLQSKLITQATQGLYPFF